MQRQFFFTRTPVPKSISCRYFTSSSFLAGSPSSRRTCLRGRLGRNRQNGEFSHLLPYSLWIASHVGAAEILCSFTVLCLSLIGWKLMDFLGSSKHDQVQRVGPVVAVHCAVQVVREQIPAFRLKRFRLQWRHRDNRDVQNQESNQRHFSSTFFLLA